jgi:dATP pyrophosphohydrolase
MEEPRYKIPASVLVVIYTPVLDVLLLRRVQDAPEGQPFWQSVTGAKDFSDEPWAATAQREVREETGLRCNGSTVLLQDWGLENVYPIYPQWLHRYAPGVWCNVERVFGLCVQGAVSVQCSPSEHSAHVWLPWHAAADQCYSASNAEAILQLPYRAGFRHPPRRFS